MGNRFKRWRALSALPLLLVMATFSAFAQLPTATILGTVRDTTGAVIPGATLTARHTETGLTRTGSSGADGSFRFAALPVGLYELRAEQAGFQRVVRTGVNLVVGQEAVLNFTMQVGAVEQTVEVTGEAPLVNTTSGSLGNLVNEQQILDLPLNGRNFVDLTLLQPGVTQLRNNAAPLTNAGTRFSTHGAPLRSNYYMLDGSPLGNPYDGTIISVSSNTLGLEGIREWQVVTSAVSAEYGMRMGAQMSMVSKGGTNTFHGSAYEFFRNRALDARNFFDYKSEAVCPNYLSDPSSCTWRLPPFQRNQFGGSAGGPIKKDRLFVFGAYEQLRQRFGKTIVLNVPASGCHGPGGATITNVDCPQLEATPSVTIAPVAAPLLALFPNPNLDGNRYTRPFTEPTDEHFGQVRGDYNFSTSDNVFLRYTIDDALVQEAVQSGYPQFTRVGVSRAQFLTLTDSHTFGSAMVGTFRFAFGQPRVTVDTEYDLIGPEYSYVSGLKMGQLNVGSGVTTLGPDSLTPGKQGQVVYTYSGDIFYTKGRHSLKFGTLINHLHPTTHNGAGLRGSITFPNFASFLRGQTRNYSSRKPNSIVPKDYTFNTVGFYLQDDLRVRSNLTLNLGLRYEFFTTHHETSGRFSALRDPLHHTEFTVGPLMRNPSLKNISPRFGFAWDVRGDGRTAVRGGFGILYDVGAFGTNINAISMQQPPWAANNSNPTPSTLTSLPLTYPADVPRTSVATLDYHMKNPHMLSYNFTVERQLPFDMSLSLAYVGTRGINILYGGDANAPIPNVLDDGRFFWLGNEPRPNPNPDFVSIGLTNAASDSRYNSLQFVLRKQLSKGLQFQSSYTWAKAIDSCNGSASADGSCQSARTQHLPRNIDIALSDFNVAHSWRFNAIYRIPEVSGWNGVRGTLLNGWWMSGILSLLTGSPFQVTTGGTDRSRSLNTAGNRPDLNPGRKNSNIVSGVTAGCPGVAAGQKLGGRELYFDPCAFSLEPLGFLGTTGRNTLIAPGLADLGFSLVKDTPLRFVGESGKLEFRADIFNIFNRVNFDEPNGIVFSAPSATVLSTAGQINSTGTSKSRQVQLALKVIW